MASAIESIDLSEKNLEQMYAGLSKVAENKDNTIVKKCNHHKYRLV